MAKRDIERLNLGIEAVRELLDGLNGKPFRWGDSERRSKEYILVCLGFAVVSKSKLEEGGHRLKRGVKPVGQAYFGAPLRKWADLYVLDVQTVRSVKWYKLYGKGKALLEGTYQIKREEYGRTSLPELIAGMRKDKS